MRVLAPALAALLVLALAGCGDDPPPGARIFDATETPGRLQDEVYDSPPPIQLYAGGNPVTDAWQGSYCWMTRNQGRCVDTIGPELDVVPDVGSPEGVDMYFPIPRTKFSATFTPVNAGCRRTYAGKVMDLGDGRYWLGPAGPPARYLVELMGITTQGEAPGAFVWTTPVPGDMNPPEAEISIVWKPDGEVEGQGFRMSIEKLAVTPRSASATVTVTAGNGASTSFDAGRPRFGCPAKGEVHFSERGETSSQEVAALGPEPFRYDVELVLDGEAYSASATWPDDHVDDPQNDDPAPVPLEFDPPLPSRE